MSIIGKLGRVFGTTHSRRAAQVSGQKAKEYLTSTQEYLAKCGCRSAKTATADAFIASSKKQGATIIGDVNLDIFGHNRLITKRLPSGTTVTVRIDDNKLIGKEVIGKNGKSFSFFDEVVNSDGKKVKSIQTYVEKNDGSSILRIGNNVHRSSNPMNYSHAAPLLESSAGMTESVRILEAPVDPKEFYPHGKSIAEFFGFY